MIPELGHFALVIALSLSLLLAGLPLYGVLRQREHLQSLARPLAWAQLLFVSLSFAALIAAFLLKDFSVSYVVQHSNSRLPWYYRAAATWGGHEGSLLLWVLILAGWTAVLARFSSTLHPHLGALVLSVLGFINVGFLSFTLFASNPFLRQIPAALDGRDLNPLLQDFGMIIHPPMLYMGYVGFSVAFALAVAGLIRGELDAAWAKWSRPWTLVAWAFLTLGIFLGSFWAYYELGWGGWWFWDAVENASFMPWLVGTALIHTLAVSEKRGSLKRWTVLLAILAFSLSLLGTFLVRSGVLSSVHAFAADPKRGLFILAFLVIVIGGALFLYAWRAPRLGIGAGFAVFSRESLLLLNNVFLLVAAASILLGTLYPLILDAFQLGKISVGPPYFDAVFVPLMLPLLLLLGIGPYAPWKQAKINIVFAVLQYFLLALFGIAVAVILIWKWSVLLVLGVSLSAWIAVATLYHVVERFRQTPGLSSWRRLLSFGASYWGMIIAHLGVAVFVAGVSVSKSQERTHEVSLGVGEHSEINAYDFRFADLQRVNGPNYIAASAVFEIQTPGGKHIVLRPERRIYTVQNMPMTEAAIDRAWLRDIYISLDEANRDNTWIVRIQIKPLMSWIWFGAILIALGGLLAAFDRRYRRARAGVVAAQVTPAAV